VIVSYFEGTQNLQEFRWEESRVNEELKKTILKAYHAVWTRSIKQQITLIVRRRSTSGCKEWRGQSNFAGSFNEAVS